MNSHSSNLIMHWHGTLAQIQAFVAMRPEYDFHVEVVYPTGDYPILYLIGVHI